MDHRAWADPVQWRCLNLILLVCLCLIRQHAAYPPSLLTDNQGPSEDSLDSRNQLDSPEQDSDYKRSSSFFPLRGKKMTLDPELTPEEDKRSQFYPLRGKKVPDDLKRGSYFMPMRGRKDDEGWQEDLEKRMSSFMPMRGKKSITDAFQRLGKPGTYAHDILYPSSSGSRQRTSSFQVEDRRNATEDHRLQKRSSSFMPMRGRREDSSPGGIATSLLEKKLSSFMPMRGRRLPEEDSSSSNQSQSDDEVKRASSFMPMRGRKSRFPDYDDEEDMKRGRPSFNAMRGRRGDLDLEDRNQRTSSFMAMRGRREDEDWMDEAKRMSFVPMRGRRYDGYDEDKRSQFMPMRGRRGNDSSLEDDLSLRERRRASGYVFSPVLVSSGIGSSLMSRHLFPASAVRSAWSARSRKVDWDSVKRGFHATRGKRLDGGCRCKRSVLRPSASHKQYIALKRPMSFFATRGKRMDSSALDPVSTQR